ncbi:MAG: biopolymer transporter ExbD [Candidatus Latescibacteria bacterium]|nr:biopolymer transporter ExbD [Candidatus Latescibacterota bacterium]
MAIVKRARASAAIPTSTMADIAFLLIVFFLVTTSMSHDKGLGLTLPPIGSATRVPSRNITKVWINAAGEIMHDQELVSLAQMGGRVKQMTEDNPNLIVSIKTAPEARYELFVDVVDEIKKAGNDKISIAEPDF